MSLGQDIPNQSKTRKAYKVSSYGEKKIPNQWIVFTQKVAAALKAAQIATGAAPVSKQFASSLKDIKPYSEWTDSDIVEAWATWEKPEVSRMAKESAPPAEYYPYGEIKERKKRAPMTEEAKVAMKAKREATAAAKKDYGINPRGDVIGVDGDYVAHWDGNNIVKGEKPVNQEQIFSVNGYTQPNTAKGNTDNNAKAQRNENNARLERIAAAASTTRNKKNKPTWGIPNFGSSAMGGATRKKRRAPHPAL